MSFSLPSSPKIKSKFKSSSSSSSAAAAASSSSSAQQLPLPSPPTTPLPTSHPLIAELTSLRQQLAQYQKAAHQASIQLQGVRLELTLAQEKESRWERERDGLKKEVEVLRTNPEPPTPLPASNALTELSLAHRRLSTKLDLTETDLSSTKLDLAKANAEIERLTKEREGDRSTINELRRIEDDREEELEWEKGERKKLEEQKKLCDLALAEYSTLVHSLDPTAVPPSHPSKTTSSIFHTPSLQRSSLDSADAASLNVDSPPLTDTSTLTALTSPETTPGEVISNLLIGQKGVQQLFTDFTSFLVSKDKHIHELECKVEELEHSNKTLAEQLGVEIEVRVEAENIRDRALRDDESASKVIERYMTFTQKTHQTIHLHLNNLRARSTATTNSLRNELADHKKDLVSERQRNSKLLVTYNDLLENYLNESTGRRREILLRLKMISAQEIRAKGIENWLNKVKRFRESIEGPVLEPDVLETLLDEGIEVISNDYSIAPTSSAITTERSNHGRIENDKFRSWRRMGNLVKNFNSDRNAVVNGDGARNAEEESLARILLAEELVTTLVTDLQMETEKRMDLERQRVEWLAQDAVDGVRAGSHREDSDEDGHIMFDVDEHGHDQIEAKESELVNGTADDQPISAENGRIKDLVNTTSYAETRHVDGTDKAADQITAEQNADADETSETPISPPVEASPLLTKLSSLFEPLNKRYEPLQKTLHDLSHSLTTLRNDLPTLDPNSPTPTTTTTATARGTSASASTSKRSHFLTISKLPSASFNSSPSHDPTLLTILDGLHEVIEDARVDVEIALADHERVYRGFEALLNVGQKKQSKEDIMDEIREYVKAKSEGTTWDKLRDRIENIELDLTSIKRAIHEMDGMAMSESPVSQDQSKGKRNHSIWDNLDLKTVSIPNTQNQNQIKSFFGISPISSPLNTPSPSIDEYGNGNGYGYGFGFAQSIPNSAPSNTTTFHLDPIRRTSNVFHTVGNVGRSFSSSVIGTPRRVSDLATGLYRPNNDRNRRTDSEAGAGAGAEEQRQRESLIGSHKINEDDHEDDVE
ncbi:uncharacterized protein I303_107980 [Kwoniella dejecticola CBS 10117]|uniref:Uncharacterized protein n=1 Tax=Kwoniella dejecticola CBS 10117 TaxID=1296121 RepID=A0A1A5ZW86_9TREE|nr:uncharacterized protein I303_07973 [Kwoniella dejecticola CBS 10117]OBR82059.1 hypothetical protein I303_07973 [Kwoniella dejecticola CBS 10117]